MGLDLTLLPYWSETAHFSHCVLELGRRSGLFERIQEIEAKFGKEVSEGFDSYLSRDDTYEESHYGITIKDPYGGKVRYLNVRHLLRFKYNEGVKNHYKNKAVWAYLKELPRNLKVALFWS